MGGARGGSRLLCVKHCSGSAPSLATFTFKTPLLLFHFWNGVDQSDGEESKHTDSQYLDVAALKKKQLYKNRNIVYFYFCSSYNKLYMKYKHYLITTSNYTVMTVIVCKYVQQLMT